MQEWYLISNASLISGDEDSSFDYGKDSFLSMIDIVGITVEVYESNGIDHSSQKCIVSNRTSDNYKNTKNRNFLFEIGTISAGSYVYYKNRYWLVQSLVDDNGVYEKAICVLTQIQIKWQDVEGNVIGCWSSISAASESDDGLESNNKTSIVNDCLIIKVPLSIASSDIVGKRIFVDVLNRKVYKITNCDTVTYNYVSSGIAVFYAERDLYNSSTDNLTLGICDYCEPVDVDPVEGNYRVALTYKGTNIYIGVDKVISATLYDQNGLVVDDAQFIWTLTTDIDDVDYDINGNQITVRVDDESALSETVTINCESLDCEKSLELVVR